MKHNINKTLNIIFASSAFLFTGTALGLVDCSAGDSLQQAIDDASNGASLNIKGECPGPFNIPAGLSITLNGKPSATLNGQKLGPTLSVASGATVVAQNLRITGGYNYDPILLSIGYKPEYSGGGINNKGNMTLNDSEVYGNEAFAGGGIAVLDNGSMEINNTDIHHNDAYRGGGISVGIESDLNDHSSMTISNSTIHENNVTQLHKESGSGGGMSVWGESTLTVIGCSVYENIGGSSGGGIDVFEDQSTLTASNTTISNNEVMNSYASGGGIGNWGKMTLTNVTIIDNVSSFFGGGISDLKSIGNATTVDSSVIINSTIRGNFAILGGGIYNERRAKLEQSVLTNNSAYYGGGSYNDIYAGSSGVMTLVDSTVKANKSVRYGGGAFNGGQSSLSLVRSHVSHNTADSNNNGSYFGGGIFNFGGAINIDSSSTVKINKHGTKPGVRDDCNFVDPACAVIY